MRVLRKLKERSSVFAGMLAWTMYPAAWAALLIGALVHWVSGRTPKIAHTALIHLFIVSQGRANDVLAKAVARFHPPYDLPQVSGVLGNLTPQNLATIQRTLERDGYCVFERCLPSEFCNSILSKTLEAECLILGDEVVSRGRKERGRYPRQAPSAPKYLLTEDDTTDVPGVQQLICDLSLIAVAQNYLKSKPIFTGMSLWWTPTVKDTPDAEAAQEFHWDMERIRWLRYFIYLTDVEADNGAHCFVKGTHRSGAIPDRLLKRGYVRHSDEEIIRTYGQEACKQFVGGRGTIIAEDSRGFHKGLNPRKGDRLLLAFELSNTTFGANKRHTIRNIHVPRFAEFAKKYPRIYENLDFRQGLLD